MSLSKYSKALGYRLTTDILVCVFNKSTNTYEYTTSASDIGRVAAEVADLDELNQFYEFVVNGEQQQWISVDSEEMTDYVIDILCKVHDRE